MATKKDLQREVDRLNKKYCEKTKNELRIDEAYGGYAIQLTGKKDKRTLGNKYPKSVKYLKGSLNSAAANVTHGHVSASKTLEYLHRQDSNGNVKRIIKSYEPEKEVKKSKRK